MSESPITVTYSLEEVLGRLEQKIDKQSEQMTKIDERLGRLEIGQARLEEKVDRLTQRVDNIEHEQKTLLNDVSDLKGTKALIIPIVVATLTSLLTLIIRAIPSP